MSSGAQEGCRYSRIAARPRPPILDRSVRLIFYQTTSGLFVGLLVAVLLRERHLDGNTTSPGRHSTNERRRGGLVVTVSLAMVAGEILSLVVLFNRRAIAGAHVTVGIAALVAVLGTAVPVALTVAADVVGPNAAKKAIQIMSWAGAAIVGLAALFGTYELGRAQGHVPAGSLNTPQRFQVYGTCAAGSCGLNERERPDPTARKLGRLEDGTAVGVICQTEGARFSVRGHASNIWDQLSNASYVSDLFISTPKAGQFSPGLRHCPNHAITNGTIG
jgi:hypothetical protein